MFTLLVLLILIFELIIVLCIASYEAQEEINKLKGEIFILDDAVNELYAKVFPDLDKE